ncbi:hypothetical protein ACJMK2_005338 [Sinanodonta woodiana]|uniref:Prominin-like protein n=1 Tax=Sinanodonta woodiana TaxID=1069815 RepID=A0ABD3VSV5_SINWO
MRILVIVVSTLLVHLVLAYIDPVYSPLILNDTVGNVAYNDSSILWADLPTGTPYKAGSLTYSTEGFDPYYNLVNSFIGTVFAYGYPISIIKGVQTGGISYVIANYVQVVPYFIGYAICVALGILFIIIFSLVGFCFCCCRCCGNCGGRKMQKVEDAKNKCKRNTFSFIMFILIALSTCGVTFVFVNNDRTTTAINTLYSTVSDNFDDIFSYIDNTVSETKQVTNYNMDFLIASLTRDLDNIDYLVGIPIRDGIDAAVNLTGVFASAYSLNSVLTEASNAMNKVNESLAFLKSNISSLDSALNSTKNAIDSTISNCTNAGGCSGGTAPDTSGMTLGINSGSFPDISDKLQNIQDAQNQNLTQQVANSENMFVTIPEKVKNDSASTVQGLTSSLNQTKESIKAVTDMIESLEKTFNSSGGSFDIRQIKDLILQYITYSKDYNKYRWYGGIGLGCAILLVILLQFLGLVFGVCGTDSGTQPTKRGCLSNCGGNMFMASVGFIFLFSWLLMLLTTITFILGAPVKKFICEPISTTDNVKTYIDGTLNGLLAGDNSYFLGGLLLQNNTIALTVSGLLSDCRDGESIYNALKLNHMFDLDAMLNYSKYFDIDAELAKVNVDFSSIDVYPTTLRDQLLNLKSGVQINFTGFYDEEELNNSADSIDSISNTEYQNTLNAVDNLKTALQDMETAVSSVPTMVDNLMSSLNTSSNYIQNDASALVTAKIRTFADRLLGIADSFVANVKDVIENKTGICTPVYNLYNSLLVITVCSYIMDTWNGFWFSLGWCILFFVPSVIFAVKLAKHFRRMKYDEFFDSAKGDGHLRGDTDLSLPVSYSDDAPKSRLHLHLAKSNKVGHKDDCCCEHGYLSVEHDSSNDPIDETISSHSHQSTGYKSPDRIQPMESSPQDFQHEEHEISANSPVVGCIVEQPSNNTVSNPSQYELYPSITNGEAPNATFEPVKTMESEW